MAALTRNRAENTYPFELVKKHYVQRADAGLIVTDAILVTRMGTEWPHAPGLWDDKHVEEWEKIVDGVHDAGTRIYAQSWHVGRAANPDMPQQKLAGTPVYAPSAISARGGKIRILPGIPGYITPTTIDDPWKIVAQFEHAAINAKKAGFDGVELHGANGSIIHLFLGSTSNKRTDEWGGSKDNRARFALEVIKALIVVFGKNVAVNVSPAGLGGYNDMGMPLDETLDTYNYYLSELDQLGLSYIVLVRYTPYMDAVYDVSYRPIIKNTPLILNGNVFPDEGTQLISAGQIDAISIGIPFITHPDLVKRVKFGKPLDNVVDVPHMQTNKNSGDWRTGYNYYPLAVYWVDQNGMVGA